VRLVSCLRWAHREAEQPESGTLQLTTAREAYGAHGLTEAAKVRHTQMNETMKRHMIYSMSLQ